MGRQPIGIRVPRISFLGTTTQLVVVNWKESLYVLEPYSTMATAPMIKPMIVSSGAHKKRTRRTSQQNKHDEEQPKPYFTGSLLTVLVEEKKESLGMIDTLSINLEDGNKNLGDDRIYFSEPRALDICCGRGKGSFWHPGNLIFQMVIRNSMDE